jgi:hypothetical protein
MPGQGHPAVLPGSASLIAAGLGGLGMHGGLARTARRQPYWPGTAFFTRRLTYRGTPADGDQP